MDHNVVELPGGDIIKTATIQRGGKYKPKLNQITRTDELVATAQSKTDSEEPVSEVTIWRDNQTAAPWIGFNITAACNVTVIIVPYIIYITGWTMTTPSVSMRQVPGGRPDSQRVWLDPQPQ